MARFDRVAGSAGGSASSIALITRRRSSCGCIPSCSQKQRLPQKLITDDIWNQRFTDINNFESYLTHNGVLPIKFFLNISKKEQLGRLLTRIDEPGKRWKFAAHDVEERKLWDQYMQAYEQTIRNTATKDAPWYVVPADHKWFTRLVVAATLVERLEALDLKFPKLDDATVAKLETIRAELVAQKPKNNKGEAKRRLAPSRSGPR